MSFLLIVRASIVLEGEYFLLGAKIFVGDLHFAGRQHFKLRVKNTQNQTFVRKIRNGLVSP